MSSDTTTKLPLNLRTNRCYVCGPDNAEGLHVNFEQDGEHGARGFYTAREEHCGWPGLLHGGLTFTLMDEALAYALYFQELYGVTARIETRFRQPIPAGAKLLIRAWTISRRKQLIDARAEIRLDGNDGALVAEATATMYLQETAPRAEASRYK
ncbi:MAG: PaaI family thioesterase [Acidobacteria bacterium]|nr:PaaI family thioesterase [Acidobacteriota bacterium]